MRSSGDSVTVVTATAHLSPSPSAVDLNARDAAVAASLLLQRGCPVDTLRRALTRNVDGSASGPLARTLDLLASEQ